jgi:putative transcriptional regulator
MMNLANHFLVAMPTLSGTLFAGSVIYVIDHGLYSGATGVIINKPFGHSLRQAFSKINVTMTDSMGIDSLYIGGPIASDNGFVLKPKTKNLTDGFELTADKSVLVDIMCNRIENAKELFVSVGYTAWDSWQLEYEIRRNDWLVVKGSPRLIFEVDPANRYQEAIKDLGISNAAYIHGAGNIIV